MATLKVTKEMLGKKSNLRYTQEDMDKLKRRIRRNAGNSGMAAGMVEGLQAMVGEGDIVLDCGANFGEFAVKFADSGAQVLCFEPDPRAFAALQDRFGDNPNVELFEAAVGTETGVIKLMRNTNFDDNPDKATQSSTVVMGSAKSESPDDAMEVELIDLLALIRNLQEAGGKIAVLKMDIEGAELDILEAMEEANLFDDINCSIVETHEARFKNLKDRFGSVRKRIAKKYPHYKVNLDWI